MDMIEKVNIEEIQDEDEKQFKSQFTMMKRQVHTSIDKTRIDLWRSVENVPRQIRGNFFQKDMLTDDIENAMMS